MRLRSNIHRQMVHVANVDANADAIAVAFVFIRDHNNTDMPW